MTYVFWFVIQVGCAEQQRQCTLSMSVEYVCSPCTSLNSIVLKVYVCMFVHEMCAMLHPMHGTSTFIFLEVCMYCTKGHCHLISESWLCAHVLPIDGDIVKIIFTKALKMYSQCVTFCKCMHTYMCVDFVCLLFINNFINHKLSKLQHDIGCINQAWDADIWVWSKHDTHPQITCTHTNQLSCSKHFFWK